MCEILNSLTCTRVYSHVYNVGFSDAFFIIIVGYDVLF